MINTGLMRRFAAILYDGLLVLALGFLATIPFWLVSPDGWVEPERLDHQLTVLLVIYLFFVGFWARKGRTLGMQSWRLQLQTAENTLPSWTQSTVRFFAAILSWLPLGLGFFWQLWDRDKLTWHDRLSGTRIVFYPKETPAPKG